MLKLQTKNKTNEDGFASLVIALVILIVIALITVGFSQLARREQQSALSNQESKQAYYAAESGINDAVEDIQAKAINLTNTIPNNQSQCQTFSGLTSNGKLTPSSGPNSTLTSGVQYTCLMVSLENDNITLDNSNSGGQYIELEDPAAPLQNLTVLWGSQKCEPFTSSCVSNANPYTKGFPTVSAEAGKIPIISVSFTSYPATGITRNGLINNTYNFVLYPTSWNKSVTAIPINPTSAAPPSNSVPYNANYNNNSLNTTYSPASTLTVPVRCSASIAAANNGYPCSITLEGVNPNGPLGYTYHTFYYNSPYDAQATVDVQGSDSSGISIPFIGQDDIDVTAVAHNVVRRIKENFNGNIPSGTVSPPPDLPTYSLEAGNICKRIGTTPASSVYYQAIAGNDSTGVTSPSDPCNLGTIN